MERRAFLCVLGVLGGLALQALTIESWVEGGAMEINRITGAIIDSAMKVHSAFGPGLLESAYKACLVYELRKRGFKVRR